LSFIKHPWMVSTLSNTLSLTHAAMGCGPI